MPQIEIGRGKTARRGYALDEVSIVPSRRTRDDQDVDTSWRLDAFEFAVPLVTVGGGVDGALDVIDAELFGQNGSFDAAAIATAITARNDDGKVSAVAVRPQRAAELVAALGRTEPDLLVIRGRVVSAEHVSRSREPLNLKTFVRGLEVPVIVGACSSHRAALHLMRTGAAGVIVASHPHSAGVGVPLATAIADVRAARMQHLDETGVYVHLIASVPVPTGGDVAKAVVCGADAVLVAPSEFRGELSSAGGDNSPQNPVRGDNSPQNPVRDGDATAGEATAGEAMIGDLRRTMATCGYESVKALQSADLVVIA